MRQWRLIVTQPTAGAYHMGIDEALFRLSEVPTLRLYGWRPPCLSIGYGQRASDVDVERLTAAGWEIVRRPTGGRAILHTDELTYSVTLPLDHPLAAGSVVESYRRISQALVVGLTHLGVNPQADEQAERTHTGAVCFETPSHYEITVQGRKLVGSAQVRRQGRLLQHGSLPLNGDLTRICDALLYPDEISRTAAKDQVRARAITLTEALGGYEIDWQTTANALINGFGAAFDLDLQTDELTPHESELAEQLAVEVYANPDWTFRR